MHVVSDFECNQCEKGVGESVWVPWKWRKSSSIHRLQGCDQINRERVKSGKLQLELKKRKKKVKEKRDEQAATKIRAW